MSKIDISLLKTRFETGDRPNGTDYENLIDTLAAQAKDLGTDGNNESLIFGIENQTILDTVSASEWRLVKYVVGVSYTANGANKYYATELSVLIDGENLNVSEYAVLESDGDVGTIDISKNGNNVVLSIIPNSAAKPVTVRYYRTGLKA
jgi:hypothetical protein